jgi:hypothetical protein
MAIGEKKIEFVDARIERRQIINLFLTLLTTGTVDESILGDLETETELISDLLHLLQKYNCTTIELLIHLVESWLIRRKICPLAGFVIGAITDRVETCRLALKYSSSKLPAGTMDVDGTTSLEGKPALDPKAMPYAICLLVENSSALSLGVDSSVGFGAFTPVADRVYSQDDNTQGLVLVLTFELC